MCLVLVMNLSSLLFENVVLLTVVPAYNKILVEARLCENWNSEVHGITLAPLDIGICCS